MPKETTQPDDEP